LTVPPGMMHIAAQTKNIIALGPEIKAKNIIALGPEIKRKILLP